MRDALAALQLLDTHTAAYNLDVVKALDVDGNDVYHITFHTADIGTAAVLVARLTPVYVATGDGADNLRVQANFEDLFFNGGDGADNITLSADALTHQALLHSDTIASIIISAPAANQQTITLAHVTGGQFDLAYGTHHTGAFGYDVASSWRSRRQPARNGFLMPPGGRRRAAHLDRYDPSERACRPRHRVPVERAASTLSGGSLSAPAERSPLDRDGGWRRRRRPVHRQHHRR